MLNEDILKTLYGEFYSLYLVNGNTGCYTVLHTTGLFKQYNNEINELKAAINDYAENYVCDRDRQKVISGADLSFIMDKLHEQKNFMITYQMKSGEWRSLKVLRTPEYDTDAMFLMGVLIYNEDMQKYYNSNRLKEVISSLSEEFQGLFRVNLKSGIMETLYFTFAEEYFPFDSIKYSAFETGYVNRYVDKDYREALNVKISPEHLMEYFRHNTEDLLFYYKEVNGNWYKLIISGDSAYNEDNPYVIMAVKECNDEILSRTNHVLGNIVLSRMFSFSVMVDLSRNSYKVIHKDDDIGKTENSGRLDMLLDKIESYVFEEDYEYFRDLFDEGQTKLNEFMERTFRAEDAGGMMHFYSGMSVRLSLPEGERLLFFVRNEDEREITKSRYERLSKEHNTTRKMLYALGDSYYAMYYFSIENNSVKVLRAPDDMRKIANRCRSYEEFTREYMYGKIHPNDHEIFMKNTSLDFLNEEICNGRTGTYCEYMRLFGSEYRWVRLDIQITAINGGRVTEIVFAIRDIHDEREKELRYNTELRQALSEAKVANAAKTTFLSNMSHDMRTPMNAILGMTDIALAHMDDTERVYNSLKKIKLSGNHLQQLINEVLDMSYVESGKMVLRHEKVFLPELFHGIVIMVQDRIKSKCLDFKAEAVNVINETIISDRVRITQILTNVLTNSIKYTPEYGSINLVLEQLPGDAPGMSEYKIIITDTGVGMSKEFLERIYEPFERAADTTESGIEGIGLGMAITMKLVKAFNGDIKVESEVLKGTRFEITLPLEYEDSIVMGRKTDLSEYEVVYYESDREYLPDKLNNAREKGRIALIHSYDIEEYKEAVKETGVDKILFEPVFNSDLIEEGEEEGTETYIDKEYNKDKRVLVVDDNMINLDIVCDYLEDMGIRPEIALNGREAYEKIISGEKYELVLMDVRMPVMDGYEATRRIREYGTEYTKNLPIIAMTANAFEEDVEASKKAGMNEHISKPIDIDGFKSLVTEILQNGLSYNADNKLYKN